MRTATLHTTATQGDNKAGTPIFILPERDNLGRRLAVWQSGRGKAFPIQGFHIVKQEASQ